MVISIFYQIKYMFVNGDRKHKGLFIIICPLENGNKKSHTTVWLFNWSGWRGSNSLPPPWQGGALPDELHPQSWCLRSESNQRHADFQSAALPTELQRHTENSIEFSKFKWRPGTGSNRRPLAWQASVLTNWTTRPNNGGNNRARTCDPLLVRQVLSQLSYASIYIKFKTTRKGLEPSTSSVTG